MGEQPIDGGEDDGGVVQGMERISELPPHMFQHILSFLSQKDAVKTCVLSKSWRCLWSARPNVEFSESDFTINGENFVHVVDRTLQGYLGQDLRINKFCLKVKGSNSLSLLEKWIPVVCALGANTLELEAGQQEAYFQLPPEFFKSQSLQNLYLTQCRWSNSVDGEKVLFFKHLRTLHLKYVIVEDRDFEKIMLSCPKIEHVVLNDCEGLRTINYVNDHNFNLKHFEFNCFCAEDEAEVASIQIYAPSVAAIIIKWCSNWFHRHLYYPNLKSLHLERVRIPKYSFDGFSSLFPCLEELMLHNCFGFEDFIKLSSASIKHMRIEVGQGYSFKAAIDAPKIVEFDYAGQVTPSISFAATTCNKWKSCVFLGVCLDDSSWLLQVSELLTGLSQSEITLRLVVRGEWLNMCMLREGAEKPAPLVPDSGFHVKPVAVENLELALLSFHSASISHFIDALFCFCRPRKIVRHHWYANAWKDRQKEDNRVTKSLCKILRMEKDECRDDREMSGSWQQDLEEVILEVMDENEDGVWHPVQATNWLEHCDALTSKKRENGSYKLRFQMRWC